MTLSKFMLNAAKLTMDALFKASEADIRSKTWKYTTTHVLYVVNHFTRMEPLSPIMSYTNTQGILSISCGLLIL
jgi:hypothetical protein